jgi:large repetitive protein
MKMYSMVLGAIMALAVPALANASFTTISGVLTEDLVLESGNTYYVSSNITVPVGRTLTVQPGVIVKINTNCCGSWRGIDVY